MADGLFSTYRTGENRVTASILAVFRALALNRTQRLIAALIEEADLELLTFRNQAAAPDARSVPDAEIVGSCRILLETKIARQAVREAQIRAHLAQLDQATESVRCLLILTPDEERPPVLERFAGDTRLSWSSFAAFDQAIDELLTDKMEVIGEREEYLLRELQRMLVDERLLGFAKDTVIVAARRAWEEYQEVHVYVCQPERAFQPVRHLGFYAEGHVLAAVPRILERHPAVRLERDRHAGRLGAVVNAILDRGRRQVGDEQQVFVLSAPTDPETVLLAAPIANDLRAANGRTTAFTQGQRYVRLDDLRRATRTSDLVEPAEKR